MTQLQRKLTLYGLTMIAVGSCIGSGIFLTPSEIAGRLPHHGFILLVWALGGLIALTGALTLAELGGMYPKSGGVYVYLKAAYGDLAGFLYGWVILLVVNTGALAALGAGLAKYLTYFLPMSETARVVAAIVVVGGLTAINMLGIQGSQRFANLFTGLKLLAIAGIIIAGIFSGNVDISAMTFAPGSHTPDNLSSALLLALIGVLWSAGGWHHASYLSGEAIDAPRTVPRAMMLGALIVTITYVLTNFAYMRLLPLEAISASETVAGEAVETLLPFGGKLVAAAIAVSIFGTIGIYTMSAPRIYFAMAQDGVFFKGLARVHPRFKTPANAMMVQAAWAIVLLLFWGTFQNLITYVTFMDIAFMGLAGAGVFVLRRKYPQAERPYRVWAYPIVPAIFVLISAAFVVNTLVEQPSQAWAGLGLTAVGVGVFRIFRKIVVSSPS